MTDINTHPVTVSSLPPAAATAGGSAASTDVSATQEDGFDLFGEDGFTFGDILDIINPLQHIPIVGTIYRALTGDEISAGARVAGGTLYGGPIGAAVATANAVLDETTGKDAGEYVMALFTGEDGDVPTAETQVAEDGAAPPLPDLAALAPLPEEAPSIDFAALAPLPPETSPVPAETPALVAEAPAAVAVQAALLEEQRADAALTAAVSAPPASGEPDPKERQPTREDESQDWFARKLLSALDKYEASAELGEITPAAVSMLR
jgi:hypothetical protein